MNERRPMKKIEKQLKNLFDYQRFARNQELSDMIVETTQQYEEQPVLLDDAVLSFASGGKKEEDEKKDPFHED